jgi:hypothetical protein
MTHRKLGDEGLLTFEGLATLYEQMVSVTTTEFKIILPYKTN